MRIYFDNAATTPMSPEVIEVMTHCMQQEFGNPSSTHSEGRKARALIELSRKSIAKYLHASIGEIFFTSGGTESNNMAIKCAVRDLDVRRIITTNIEHHCVLHTVESMEKYMNVDVVYLEVDKEGKIDLSELESVLQESTVKTLVSIMHANNEIGTLNDIATIGNICHSNGALFHSDTVQTVGHYPVHADELNIDFFSGAAHKFHGPKGIGLLYINSRNAIKPFIDGGAQERNMRGGTENIYGIVGMARALEDAYEHLDERIGYISELRSYLKESLLEWQPEICMNGEENGLYTVLNVAFPPNQKSEMLLTLLDIHGISVSGGSACSSGSDKGSHVIGAIGRDPSWKSVRFSFSHFNTKSEIDQVMEKLKTILPITTFTQLQMEKH
jgi:cysteine desulfurase